jgi:quaternary ammonium compound-resistance protein SugE
MAWFYLFVAGLFECGWAIALKYSDGFTRLWPSLISLVVAGLSFWLLGLAMRTIPAGTAYAVWTGIGIIGVGLYGIVFWQESAGTFRLLFLLMILGGVIGLKLVE